MIEETVESLARMVAGRVVGDGARRIVGLGDLRASASDRIGFLRSAKYAEAARRTKIGALVTAAVADTPAAQIVVDNVDASFARIARHFHPQPVADQHAVHPSAVVEDGAVLEEPVDIGPHVVVRSGARIGAGSVLMPGVVVGRDSIVGRRCVLFPNTVLYDRVELGEGCSIHAGAVLGCDGFGNAWDGRRWISIPQLGVLQLGDDVEVGANSTLDRGALGSTRIGDGGRIDNLVHVGHNCEFGEAVAVAGLTAFAGSVKLGDRVVIGGHVVFGGHLEVADDIRIGGNSGVHRSLTEPGDYLGYPVMPKNVWLRTMVAMRDLVGMRSEISRLRAELDELRDAGGGERP